MYKNSKFTILLPTVIACSLAAGMLLGSFLLRSGADRPARRAALSVAGTDKLNMLLRLIDAQYVDTVRMDSLTEEIIPLILENLDPHSMYFSAKDLAQANETIEGEFDGIGVVFNMATDTVIVLNVIAGGPSAKAGIQGGDRIVTVEDSTIAGVGMDHSCGGCNTPLHPCPGLGYFGNPHPRRGASTCSLLPKSFCAPLS